MITPALEEALRPVARMQRVLWFAFTFSIFLYIAVLTVVVGVDTGAADENPPLRFVLQSAGFAMALAALLLRRILFSDARITAMMRSPSRGIHPSAKLAVEHEQRAYNVVVRMQAPLIAVLAVNEAVALVGLILGILTRSTTAIVPFAAAALLLNLVAFPQPARLAERALELRVT